MVGKKLLKIHKEQIRLHALPVKLNTVAEWLVGCADCHYALCAMRMRANEFVFCVCYFSTFMDVALQVFPRGVYIHTRFSGAN